MILFGTSKWQVLFRRDRENGPPSGACRGERPPAPFVVIPMPIVASREPSLSDSNPLRTLQVARKMTPAVAYARGFYRGRPPSASEVAR